MMLSSAIFLWRTTLIPDVARRFTGAAANDEDAHAEAFEGEEERLFAIVLLPRKQALYS